LIKYSGRDVTHWFDRFTRQPKTSIDPQTEKTVYYTPEGAFLHVPSILRGESLPDKPWWKGGEYCIGSMTQKKRQIKIVNMLTKHEDVIEVPCEETIYEILDRYKEINFHAASYTWKRLGQTLDMSKTLEENGIIDET